jgi:hypothetical protein
LGASTAASALVFLELVTNHEMDGFIDFIKAYLRHIPFYIVDCLVYSNLGRLDAPLKLLQPLDTPENPAESVCYVSGCLGARFSKLRRRYLSVESFAVL